MKLILNSNGDYQTQSDAFINFYELKCHLQGEIQGSSILINRNLLNPLPPIKKYSLATFKWGEYQEFAFPPDFENIDMTIEFNDNGIIFFVWLNINTQNGNVDLSFVGLSVLIKQFRLPKDLTDESLIKAINREKVEYIPKSHTGSNDSLLNYITGKYLKSFEDWLDTLAALPRKAICHNCVFNYKYNISRQCKEDLFSEKKIQNE